MSEQKLLNLKALLDENYIWPNRYLFKFIVKPPQLDQLKSLFETGEFSQRPSSKGTYIALTIDFQAESSEQIISIYESAALIEGVISL